MSARLMMHPEHGHRDKLSVEIRKWSSGYVSVQVNLGTSHVIFFPEFEPDSSVDELVNSIKEAFASVECIDTPSANLSSVGGAK